MKKPIALGLIFSLGTGCSHLNAPQTPHQKRESIALAEQERLQYPGNYQQEENTESSDNAFFLAISVGIVGFFDSIGNLFDSSTRTPAVAARRMEDSTSADERRKGIADLVTQWKVATRPPYTTRYKQIAQNDPDYTVRAMAIRALNISRDASATAIFMAGLDDNNELVRLEAAKALANIPDPKAIPALLHTVEGKRVVITNDRPQQVDEAKDVRIAAADALRKIPNLDVARTLVSLLNERDFGVAWESRRSLIILTGRDWNYDQGAWLKYLSVNPKPFG